MKEQNHVLILWQLCGFAWAPLIQQGIGKDGFPFPLKVLGGSFTIASTAQPPTSRLSSHKKTIKRKLESELLLFAKCTQEFYLVMQHYKIRS